MVNSNLKSKLSQRQNLNAKLETIRKKAKIETLQGLPETADLQQRVRPPWIKEND